jgi:hypothetical protein
MKRFNQALNFVNFSKPWKTNWSPNNAAEQIVGPERRLRVLHHHWSGGG